MKTGGNYAASLRKLATALRKVDPTFEWDAIDGIAGTCHGLSSKLPEWQYVLKDFSFPTKSFKAAGLDKVRPDGVKNYNVVLSVEARGAYSKDGDFDDPIKDLEVNIVVNVMPSQGPDSIYCAWHLDSHPPKNSVGATASKFPHPRYHWQYGGKKVWESPKEDFFGSHLLLESPRLPHPPLDLILAIDFVFANYYGQQWQELRKDGEYQRVIEEAQNRYWRPYFASIYTSWTHDKPVWSPLELVPFLYPK